MRRSIWRHGIIHAVALGSLMGTMLIASSAGAATGAPSAPRSVQASGLATTINVSWKKPAKVGADAVRDYVVTSHPSSKTCATRTTNCNVKGLKLGTAYTFSVVAKNGAGTSARATSNRVEVASASTYFTATVAAFDQINAVAESDAAGASTAAQQQAGIDALDGALDFLVGEFKLEQWPSASSAAVATFLTDSRDLETGLINAFEASSSSITAADLSLVQGETNTDNFAFSTVLTDLGQTSPVVASNATTPTPVALTTAQTITDLFGDQISVTATQVVDPATAATGSGLADAGYRFVAVDFNIDNESENSVTGDANFSASVTGSDGNSYTADYGAVSECSNFTYGEFELLPNDSTTGCVVFELPTSVTVQSIHFTFAPGYLDTAEWSS